MEWLDQDYLNDLVKRAYSDSNAFAELFSAVSDRLYSYCRFIRESEEEAYELLEEVFVKIRQEFFSLQNETHFLPWALRTAFLCDHSEKVLREKDTAELNACLNLPLTQSQVMIMLYCQNISLPKTAKLLNLKPSLVKRVQKNALSHLNEFGIRLKNTTPQEVVEEEVDAYKAILILEKAYDSVSMKPNSIPLEALSSYTVYRRERFSLQRGIAAGILTLFVLLPLLFVLPRYQILSEEVGSRGLPVYTIRVDNLLPVGSVVARMRSHTLPVYEKNRKNYTIEPVRNGELSISVELFNRQSVTSVFVIDNVDSKCPQLINSAVRDHQVFLYVEDEGIGVDYREVYAKSTSGMNVLPLSYDENEGVIVFDYPSEPLDIYIPDHIGNMLHLSINFRQ